MESFFVRYRNPMVLGMVLLLQVFGLAVQVKRPLDPRNPESGSVRLVRLWAVGIFSPFEKILVGTGHWARQSWHDYVNVGALRHENRELREENERLRLGQVQLAQDAAQARRLQSLLEFKEKSIGHTIAAQVIGSSGTDQSRVLYIDKGAKDGLKPGMAVITPDGVVGKVRETFSSTSQILVMNDSTSGVGALLEKSRLHGVAKGNASGELMLDHIMTDEKVEPGERVITSGGDRLYPKGLPVGTVEQVSPGSDLFLNIRVKPAADLSRLEEVLVVTQIEGAQELAEAPMRVSDILAQRLPGVPPQAEIATQLKPEKTNVQLTPQASKPVVKSAAEKLKITTDKNKVTGTSDATGIATKPKITGATKPKKSEMNPIPGQIPSQLPVQKPPQAPVQTQTSTPSPNPLQTPQEAQPQ